MFFFSKIINILFQKEVISYEMMYSCDISSGLITSHSLMKTLVPGKLRWVCPFLYKRSLMTSGYRKKKGMK